QCQRTKKHNKPTNNPAPKDNVFSGICRVGEAGYKTNFKTCKQLIAYLIKNLEKIQHKAGFLRKKTYI
ncbi:MAG: hypothetical protein L3J58_12320, partial [Emcibacter sp.]|nr:hypothetical protein [Emcibacter sp.]